MIIDYETGLARELGGQQRFAVGKVVTVNPSTSSEKASEARTA